MLSQIPLAKQNRPHETEFSEPKRLLVPADSDGSASEIREKLWSLTESLPVPVHMVVQAYFDWLTGKPRSGQQPLWSSNPWLELCFGIVEFIGGATIWLMVGNSPQTWLFIPASWLLTIAGSVQLREVAHHCAHQRFSREKLLNFLVGSIITAVVQMKEFTSFKSYHNTQHHHLEKLATMEHDPANKPYLVNTLKFQPGRSKDFYWQRLWQILVSPQFHFQTLSVRLRDSLVAAPLYHRLLTLSWFSAVLTVVAVTHSWVHFLLWVIPSQIGFQVAVLLQLITEHNWGYVATPGESSKSLLLGKCMSRFLGSAPPNATLCQQPLAWLNWSLQMVGYVVTRMTVLCLNLPAHSYHHTFPNNQNWANEIYDLQEFTNAGCLNWPGKFPEVWGLWNAIDFVFESLSREPQKYRPNKATTSPKAMPEKD